MKPRPRVVYFRPFYRPVPDEISVIQKALSLGYKVKGYIGENTIVGAAAFIVKEESRGCLGILEVYNGI